MAVATSHAIMLDKFCVKTAAISFVSQLLEDARLFAELVMESGISWKEVPETMGVEYEQKLGNMQEIPHATQVDEVALMADETNYPASEKEEERKGDDQQTSYVESAEIIPADRTALQDVELAEAASDEDTTSKDETNSSILKHENLFRRFCVKGRKMITCLRNFAKKFTPSDKSSSSKREANVISEERLSGERKVKKYSFEVQEPSLEGTWKMAECGDGLETEV